MNSSFMNHHHDGSGYNHSFINSSATATASSMELSAGMKAHGMLMLLGWGLFLLPGSAVRASFLVDLQGITAPSLS